MPAKLPDPTDIVGRRYGRLVVEKYLRVEPYIYGKASRVRKNYLYLCRCDCGNSIDTIRVHLLTGHVKSCHCWGRPKAGASPRWTGYAEISGFYWGRLQRNASIREIPFRISIEYAWECFLRQSGHCALSGEVLVFGTGRQTASLDRIDSQKSYEIGNVQWVHKDINMMKMDLPSARFIELCRAVADYMARVLPPPYTSSKSVSRQRRSVIWRSVGRRNFPAIPRMCSAAFSGSQPAAVTKSALELPPRNTETDGASWKAVLATPMTGTRSSKAM